MSVFEPAPFEVETRTVVEHLRRHALRYYPDLIGGVRVQLSRVRRRPASSIYHYDLVGERGRHGVVVKFPQVRLTAPQSPGPADGSRARSTAACDRPRLHPLCDGATKHRLEHRAVAAMEAGVRVAAQPGVQAVRVLDHLPEQRALVLEEVADPTLFAVTWRSGRQPGHRVGALVEAYGNAGRWLSIFHSIPPPQDAVARRATGREVVDTLGTYADHLAGAGAPDDILRRLGRIAAQADGSLFPAHYPLGWGHGDPAPRNFFVRSPATVAGFDVLGRWRTPFHEDLAYFLTALRCDRRRVLTRGASGALIPFRLLERAFLEGYGIDERFERRIRAYELLLLVDRWASVRARVPASGGRATIAAYRRLADGFFVRRLTTVLAELGEDGRARPGGMRRR